MTIALRVTKQENERIKFIAKLHGKSVSEYIRRAVSESIRDEFDLQCYHAAKTEYEADPAVCATEEFAKMLGIDL